MAQVIPDQLKLIDTRALWRKALLLVPVALAMAGAWFALRWAIGSTIAERPPNEEIARSAAQLSPDDAQTQRALAVFSRRSFLTERQSETLLHYERAVGLSPNDYLLWMELGRERESAGDAPGSEKAFRRAVKLAPFYAYPRWYLGNFLLRQGREEEAFAELRRAGEANPEWLPQIFYLASRVYHDHVPSIVAVAGNTVTARAKLAQYFIGKKQIDDALKLWSGLSANEKREQQEMGQALMRALFTDKRFRDVLDVYRTLVPEDAEVSVGHIKNGGFEGDIGPPGTSLFDWQVVSLPQAQIRLDAATRLRDKRSLRIIFNASTSLDFQNVSQFIIVEPSTRYRLEHYVRIEDLKSASTLITEIVDASDPSRVLASSEPLPNGTKQWEPITLDFNTSPQTQAITVRLSRASCITGACPIFGKVWYDDFNLQRTGGGSGKRDSGAPGDDAQNSSSR